MYFIASKIAFNVYYETKFELLSSMCLSDYLKILFLVSVFGGFAEEVAYRGYVQTRVSKRYGVLIGIVVSTLFFSLQHIHVFQTGWILQFAQGQLLHVVLFGVCGILVL